MFDLDALIAEESQGDEPEPFTFTFDGNTYTLPGRVDGRAIAATDSQRVDRALRILAGPEQWAQIEASPKILTLQTIDALLGAWIRHCGGETLGKRSRSAGRSKSTAKQSSTTSKRSTGSASLKSVRKN